MHEREEAELEAQRQKTQEAGVSFGAAQLK